jgi:ribosomal protein S18 acetylase RimI-like enzyme
MIDSPMISLAPELSLRPVGAEDYDFLVGLYTTTRIDEFAAIPWSEQQREMFMRMQFDLQSRVYEGRYPDAAHQLILWNGERVGRTIVDRAVDEIRLVDIALLPEFRAKGIGGCLIRDLQNEAAENSKPVRLEVFRTNPAQRLYYRLGFRQTGTNSLHLEMEWKSAQAAISVPEIIDGNNIT